MYVNELNLNSLSLSGLVDGENLVLFGSTDLACNIQDIEVDAFILYLQLQKIYQMVKEKH